MADPKIEEWAREIAPDIERADGEDDAALALRALTARYPADAEYLAAQSPAYLVSRIEAAYRHARGLPIVAGSGSGGERGDSHARAWIPAFNQIIEAGGWTAYYLVKPQCTAAHVTIASTESDQPFTDCSDFQDWVMEQVIAMHPDLVVVASSPPVNGVFDGDKRSEAIDAIAPILRKGYDELFLELSASADRVALIRDVPKSPHERGLRQRVGQTPTCSPYALGSRSWRARWRRGRPCGCGRCRG